MKYLPQYLFKILYNIYPLPLFLSPFFLPYLIFKYEPSYQNPCRHLLLLLRLLPQPLQPSPSLHRNPTVQSQRPHRRQNRPRQTQSSIRLCSLCFRWPRRIPHRKLTLIQADFAAGNLLGFLNNRISQNLNK